MLFWFAASPIWWWFVGLPMGGGLTSIAFFLPPTLVSVVAMLVVLGGVALFSRAALEY